MTVDQRVRAGFAIRRGARSHVLAPAAVLLVLAACGSGEKGAALPPNPDVIVGAPAGRGLIFDNVAYAAKAGDVGIEYDNNDVQTHTMIITDAGGAKLPGFTKIVLGAHRKTGLIVAMQPGVYNLICDIHLPTMVATLTISA